MKKTFLQRLDPRAKFIALFLFAGFIFLTRSWFGMISAIALVLAAISASPLSFSQAAARLRHVVWFVVVIIIVQMLTTSGRVVFEMGGTFATYEGLNEGLFLSMKIALLFLASSLFVVSTPIEEILDGIETSLARFKRSGSLFLLLGITLNFVPELIRSARKIKSAQIARGADVDSSLLSQLRFAASAALPLFVSAFRSSQHLADAIDARGFNAEFARTPFRQPAFQIRDWLMLGGLLIFVLLSISLRYADIVCPL